jgi:crotonobetainyl-CoA:carnitine CoA-transferase CaiB-like acyl-CoA transferase
VNTIDGPGSRTGPLHHLRVVDLSTSYAGPTAAMYLADLGADVVKIERPGGDDARAWGPPFVDGVSAWFASANRNKRSVVLDLRRAEGLDVLHRLLTGADVFLVNLNPAKLADLNLDPDTVRALQPRLIYCLISGFGLDGPDYARPGYDLVAQARSGLMSVTGPDGGPPQRVSTALSDVAAGMCAALAISAAAVRQASAGIGDVIDVSLLDTDLALMAPRIAAYLAGEPEPAPSGGTDSVLAVYQAFPTADRDLVIAIGNDAMWRRFTAVIGLPALADDPGLADNARRRERRSTLLPLITGQLRQRPAREWRTLLGQAGVPCSYVHSLSEVVTDPQITARSGLLPVPGSGGQLTGVHGPFRLRSTGTRNERYPQLGGDSRAVLGEAGYSPAEIDSLVRAGIVGEPPGPPAQGPVGGPPQSDVAAAGIPAEMSPEIA